MNRLPQTSSWSPQTRGAVNITIDEDYKFSLPASLFMSRRNKLNFRRVRNPLVRYLASGALSLIVCLPAHAAPKIELFDYAINIDGSIAVPADPLPSSVNPAGFDFTSGLGNLKFTIAGDGPHFLGVFLDHDIDADLNTFFNETGGSSGAPASGQTWEIGDGSVVGSIYDHLFAGALGNANDLSGPDDVSLALGNSFSLLANETATLTFTVSMASPPAGFFLRQTDPDSDVTIYFSNSLVISSPSADVPDAGATVVLLFLALLTLNSGLRWSVTTRRA